MSHVKLPPPPDYNQQFRDGTHSKFDSHSPRDRAMMEHLQAGAPDWATPPPRPQAAPPQAPAPMVAQSWSAPQAPAQSYESPTQNAMLGGGWDEAPTQPLGQPYGLQASPVEDGPAFSPSAPQQPVYNPHAYQSRESQMQAIPQGSPMRNDGQGLIPQAANNTPGPVPVVNGQRINRLMGMPIQQGTPAPPSASYGARTYQRSPYGYTPPGRPQPYHDNGVGLYGSTNEDAARLQRSQEQYHAQEMQRVSNDDLERWQGRHPGSQVPKSWGYGLNSQGGQLTHQYLDSDQSAADARSPMGMRDGAYRIPGRGGRVAPNQFMSRNWGNPHHG